MSDLERRLWGWEAERAGGLKEALRFRTLAARRVPTEADTPPLSTFPGRNGKPIPGQLNLFDLDGDDGRRD
jgi:hypothetical protein